MSTDISNLVTNDTAIINNLNTSELDSVALINSTLFNDSINIDSLQFSSELKQEKLFFEGKPIHSNQEHWISGIILFCFVLLAFINFNHKRRFSQMIKVIFAKNYMNQLIREGNFFKERISLLLFIIYALIIPLFIYFSLEVLMPLKGLPENIQIFTISIIPLGIWLFKVLVIKLNSMVFKTPKPAYEIMLYIFISNLILSLLILPLISIYYFTEIEFFLFFAFGIAFSIYIIRIIREFMIGLSYSIFSILHLFLYLCCLEIIPIVILIKIISVYDLS